MRIAPPFSDAKCSVCWFGSPNPKRSAQRRTTLGVTKPSAVQEAAARSQDHPNRRAANAA
ncbi:MAG TPA: hypothetical protein VG476_02310 [Acidimicrobiales bacterium]|nr:hypothetical protein [Acidimicrobiales bacterium]